MLVSFKPRRRADLVVHQLDDEGLIFDPVACDTHRLNSTAMYLWNRCTGVISVQGLVREMVRDYEVSVDDARTHVVRTITEFTLLGLLEPVTDQHQED